MKRFKMDYNKSKRLFHRTAGARWSHKKNSQGLTMNPRGGIRL